MPCARAFWMASLSRGLPSGLVPPSLAATVTSRASFEKSFALMASCRPFRCMMFLNCEWPAIAVIFRSFGGNRPGYRPPHRDRPAASQLSRGSLTVEPRSIRRGRRSALVLVALARRRLEFRQPIVEMDPEQLRGDVAVPVGDEPVGLVEEPGMDVELAGELVVLVADRRAALGAERAHHLLGRLPALRSAFERHLLGAETRPHDRRRAGLAAAVPAMAPRHLEGRRRGGDLYRAAEAAAVQGGGHAASPKSGSAPLSPVPMRSGMTRRASPVASSISTARPDRAAGPSAGPKR